MSDGSQREATGGALAELVRATEPSLRAHADRRRTREPGVYETAFGDDRDRAFVAEAVLEGWRMHYDTPRVFLRTDEDLRLLGGDALYAVGLARLAELGDLDGIAELADLISLCARVAAEGRSELASELWSASVARLSGQTSGGAQGAFDEAPG